MAISRQSDKPAAVPDRVRRLAQRIDALAEKDEQFLLMTREMDRLRHQAAGELYAICRGLVDSLNGLTERAELTLDPEEFAEKAFRAEATTLFQIGVRGRILQVAFSATPELVSTEDFRVPYTLAGTVRAFNQEFLERKAIEEQQVFYTVEKSRNLWRYFDPRTYHSGTFDQEYLVAVLEELL